MSSIQAWVLSLCGICIVCSVLFTFIKNEKINNSIKTVLALYILVTALNPMIKIGSDISYKDITASSTTAIDTNAIVAKNAQNQLLNDTNIALEQENLSVKCISITLSDDMSQITRVTISQEDEEAKAVIKELFGDNIEITVQKEG